MVGGLLVNSEGEKVSFNAKLLSLREQATATPTSFGLFSLTMQDGRHVEIGGMQLECKSTTR